jgi:two-component system, cell cycle sensor histidine kinase and response regulator CckA
MGTLSLLNILAGLLELCVPSYAFRLVRRFGVQQAGRFVVIAFASLALLHLLNPIKPASGSGLVLAVVYGGASLLLLIGMGHVETLCQERQRVQHGEKELRAKLEQEARQRADDLTQIKQEMAQEIVRLQQQVETLSLSERQFRFLFTQHPHPMWIFDLRTGRILAGNEAALRLYGFTQREFTALVARDLLSREAHEGFMADAAKPCTAVEARGIWRHRKKDRTPIDVSLMAVDLRFGDCPARLLLAEDLTPRFSRELELRESERIRTLRSVAEGVAHHFGQILAVTEEQARRVADKREAPGDQEALGQMLEQTRRGAVLMRQLLAAGSCEILQPEPVCVNSFVRDREHLLRRLVGERITLGFHFGEALSPALVDVRALEQILVNLVLNARDALPHGGSIEIHTEPAWAEPRANVNPGHFVHLRVRDNGCGMTLEVQERLFQPFFTTREDGKAMGLGLATIYGAVRQHGGWVDFATEPGHGSEFSVYLPVAQPASEPTQEPALAATDRETILLVEANDQVRDLARHILCRNGYHVIEADTPATATLLMESQAGNIQVLLTDLSFPDGGSGRDLAGQLSQLKPDLKVIYATVPLSPEDNEPALLQEASLLLKPYTPDRLLQALAASLNSHART